GVEETKRLIEETGGHADGHLADLSTESGASGLVEAAVTRFGRLDILVNNAAIRRNTPFIEMSLSDWHEVMANSLDCAFLCARYAVPHMQTGQWGRIVNITGITLHRGTPGRAHVGAAKAAMVGMSRSLALEVAGDGITVNCVSPGLIDTVRGGAAGARPDASKTMAIPVGREGRPDEIAHVVTMLCRPDGAYTTGQTIQVNGGTNFS
ncbi:MAG: SDR family NAD(P)-dependent oxidoreductase, partial [Methyloligellaceae bacterium]